MVPTINYEHYRLGYMKAVINYFTYDLERTIYRREKDCTNKDEEVGYTDATLDITRNKKEIDKFSRDLYARIYT